MSRAKELPPLDRLLARSMPRALAPPQTTTDQADFFLALARRSGAAIPETFKPV